MLACHHLLSSPGQPRAESEQVCRHGLAGSAGYTSSAYEVTCNRSAGRVVRQREQGRASATFLVATARVLTPGLGSLHGISRWDSPLVSLILCSRVVSGLCFNQSSQISTHFGLDQGCDESSSLNGTMTLGSVYQLAWRSFRDRQLTVVEAKERCGCKII